jgi:peptidase YpeB-like protein
MRTLAICASLLFVTTAAMRAGDQSAAIPTDVMAALTRKFPQATVDKWTKEKEGGKEVYDIEFHQGTRKFEADIFADGTIHNWEQQIAAADLPQPVTNTVSRKFPHAVMKEIMAVTDVQNGREQLTGYEVVIQRPHKKDVEMTVAPDGKVLEGPGAEK